MINQLKKDLSVIFLITSLIINNNKYYFSPVCMNLGWHYDSKMFINLIIFDYYNYNKPVKI